MWLYRQAEVPENEQGLLCRQSRLAGVVRLIVWCIVLAIPPAFSRSKPWVFWGCVAVAAVVIPLAARELAAQFRATNWLMRVGADGLWINLRSYGDRDVVPDAPSVVRLGYAEITGVAQHTEAYSTPSRPDSNAPTVWQDKYLEIELTHDQSEELKSALNKLRFPPAPAQPSSGPVRAQVRVSPVWFVNPSLLRVAWKSGHGPVIAPGLAQVLSQLETHVRVAPPTRRDRPNWLVLTPDEATDLARELVHVHGETFVATNLLARACHISDGEAGAQVQQFEAERIG